MSAKRAKYQPLPQSERDSLLLQIIAVLSAVFCLAMLSIASYILLHKIAPFEAIVLMFYIATLFGAFSYAALAINHQAQKQSLIENKLNTQSFCRASHRHPLQSCKPQILANSSANERLFELKRK